MIVVVVVMVVVVVLMIMIIMMTVIVVYESSLRGALRYTATWIATQVVNGDVARWEMRANL